MCGYPTPRSQLAELVRRCMRRPHQDDRSLVRTVRAEVKQMTIYRLGVAVAFLLGFYADGGKAAEWLQFRHDASRQADQVR